EGACRPAEEGDVGELLLGDEGRERSVRQDGEDVPVAHVLGRNDARTFGNVLDARDRGADADHPEQQEQVGLPPVAANGPAEGGALAHQDGVPADDDGEDHGLAEIEHVEQQRADRLDDHEVWLKKRRTVSREVIAVRAAMTGTTAAMPRMPSMPSE